MKIDIIRLIVAIALSALIAWGFSALSVDASSALTLGIVSSIELVFFLSMLIAVNIPDYPRTCVMMRTASGLGILVTLVINGIYAFIGVGNSYYIISGIVLLTFLLILNSIYKSKQ